MRLGEEFFAFLVQWSVKHLIWLILSVAWPVFAQTTSTNHYDILKRSRQTPRTASSASWTTAPANIQIASIEQYTSLNLGSVPSAAFVGLHILNELVGIPVRRL